MERKAEDMLVRCVSILPPARVSYPSCGRNFTSVRLHFGWRCWEESFAALGVGNSAAEKAYKRSTLEGAPLQCRFQRGQKYENEDLATTDL